MTTQADAPVSEAHPAPAVGSPAGAAEEGPLVYLGMRRGWWVVLCLLLLVAVDLISTIGPYLALGVLMWMVTGLAHAKPRPEPVPDRGRAAQPRRSAHSEQGAALPS